MDVYTLKIDKNHGIPRKGALVMRSDDDRTAVRFDYSLGRWTQLGLTAQLDQEDGTAAALVQLPGLSCAVKVENRLLRLARGAELGAELDWSEGLRARWAPAVSGTRSLDLGALVFGEQLQQREVVETVVTELTLPEGAYPCVVSIVRITLQRKRVPELTTESFPAAEVRYVTPPPFPGKSQAGGGDDWIERAYLPRVAHVSDALGEQLAQVMRRRESGGYGWKPESPEITEQGYDSVPIADAAAVETARRWLAPAQIETYRNGEVGLVVVRLEGAFHVTTQEAFRGARTALERISAAIPGVSERHIAVVGGGKLAELSWNEEGIEVFMPFDLEIWPGPVSVFVG